MQPRHDPQTNPDTGWYLILIVFALMSSLAIALFVKGGYGDIQKLEERRKQLLAERVQLKKRLRDLNRRKRRLRKDPYLIERLARERLGLSKPGEKKILMKNLGDTGTDSVDSSTTE